MNERIEKVSGNQMGKGKRKALNRPGMEQEAKPKNKVNKSVPGNINKFRLFNTRLDLIVCTVLILVTFAVYWQVTNHEFILFDDDAYVTKNPHVKSGLTSESVSWSFSFSDKNKIYWHPLTWLSHMLDCHLYGLKPGMHHLTNLIFHISNCLLLFLVFRRMTGTIWKSAFVAALFALHPINVDSVAWVAERKNLLSTFFWMFTMLSYTYYCELPRPYRYLLTLSVFAVGLLAKPMLVTLPFVLLMLDYWPLERLRHFTVQSVFRLIVEKIPFFVASAISVYLSISSLKGYGVGVSLEQVPMSLRISNALVSYINYIGKMIWPQDLAILYPYPSSIPFWKPACSGLFLILISLGFCLKAKRRPYLLVGWLWFLGTFVPVTGLVQAGLWPAMADRWAYIPLIGLFIMIGWGAPDLLARWRYKKAGLATMGAIVLSSLTVTTFLQLKHWKNSITLFEHSLRVTTNNSVIHTDLGVALGKQGRITEAIEHYSEAIRINPMFAEAHNNLGLIAGKQGKITEAISHFSEALRIDPYYDNAHTNLGVAFVKQGKLDEAISHFSEALRINPKTAKTHNNLGITLVKQGKITEAIRHFSEAVRIDPSDSEARNNLKAALALKR